MSDRKCYGCGETHGSYFGPYFWQAAQANNSFWPEAWNVWAIQECGAHANTECVATFVGKYHNAKANSEECARLHNLALVSHYTNAGIKVQIDWMFK